jgi:hypothetical protein
MTGSTGMEEHASHTTGKQLTKCRAGTFYTTKPLFIYGREGEKESEGRMEKKREERGEGKGRKSENEDEGGRKVCRWIETCQPNVTSGLYLDIDSNESTIK